MALQKKSDVELKPCPFCGHNPRFCSSTDMRDDFDHGYTISCDTCGFEIADEYKDEVARQWNTRTDATNGPARVPEGQTPLDEGLSHPLLRVFNEGVNARDEGTPSPYHGQSLEHCIHSTGWVQRDLRLALDALSPIPDPADGTPAEAKP